MTKNELKNKLLEIINDISFNEISDLSDELNLDEHGFDSLLIVQLIIEIESALKIEFDEEDMDLELLNNVGSLLNTIERKIN